MNLVLPVHGFALGATLTGGHALCADSTGFTARAAARCGNDEPSDLLVRTHSSRLPKPNRLSRLVNRLKIETYSPTVAST